MPSRERKAEYFARVKQMYAEYTKILVVGCNNVGSKQFQQIRTALRGKAVVLMGKNTMMRRIIADLVGDDTSNPINNVLPLVVGNIGFIFTKGDLSEVKKIVENNRVPAAAKAGQVASVDVIVPPGPTGCDPGQTQWFQALNVPTKITKGQIEIVSELKLIPKGNVVGNSEAALLQKLNIKPFSYGLVLSSVYDNGAVFDAKVLDITADALNAKFYGALSRMAALSLASGYPTMASLPHSVGNGVRTLIAIAAASGYSFEQMAEFDKFLNMSPEELAKLAAASAASSGAPASPSKGGAPKKEEVKEVRLSCVLRHAGLAALCLANPALSLVFHSYRRQSRSTSAAVASSAAAMLPSTNQLGFSDDSFQQHNASSLVDAHTHAFLSRAGRG